MTPLKDKLENALNESRILILGAQVLIGFGFRAIFEHGFSNLPPELQNAKVVSLGLMILALGLLVSPVPYHRIVAGGELEPGLHSFTHRMSMFALLPFALGLGVDLFVAASKVLPDSSSWAFGVITAAIALYFWYGLEYQKRLQGKGTNNGGDNKGEHVELKDKIKEVLIEARMVLPGAQALLGFQFIVVLVDTFDVLPRSLQLIHLWSLFAVALCTILLIAPAAYHRIVNRGEDSEEFLQFAHRIVLAAMVPLAIGLAGDFLIVTWVVTKSMKIAIYTSAATLALLLGFWFGYMWWVRSTQGESIAISGSHRKKIAA
ncbi:MAG: hypothetical protein JWO13_2947 [Acidobacteriales bacterium]|nr:hypothetical protein [Terriglobales bacterium]